MNDTIRRFILVTASLALTVAILGIGIALYRQARSYVNNTATAGDTELTQACTRLLDKYNGRIVNTDELKKWLYELTDYDRYVFIEATDAPGILFSVEEYTAFMSEDKITITMEYNSLSELYSQGYRTYISGMNRNDPNPMYLNPAKKYLVSIAGSGEEAVIRLEEI